MNIINQIQRRIGKLKEMEMQEIQSLDSLEKKPIGSIQRRACWDSIRELNQRRTEWEYLLQTLEPEQPEPAKKIVPVVGIKERTEEENEQFLKGLILKGFNVQRQGQYFHDLIQYFTNTASLLWCAGLIDKLEEIERNLPISNVDAQEAVSGHLHKAFAELQSLQENCNLLETKLEIK
jgi:hypothetical protein